MFFWVAVIGLFFILLGGLLLLFCFPSILFFRRHNPGLAKKLLLAGAIINIGLGGFMLQHALHNIHHAVAFRGGSGDTVMLTALGLDVVYALVAMTK